MSDQADAPWDEIMDILKAACDRSWSDETPLQVANIVSNAIYFRDNEIAYQKARAEKAEATLSALRPQPETPPSVEQLLDVERDHDQSLTEIADALQRHGEWSNSTDERAMGHAQGYRDAAAYVRSKITGPQPETPPETGGPLCATCQGTGWCEGSPAFTCPSCKGSGCDKPPDPPIETPAPPAEAK